MIHFNHPYASAAGAYPAGLPANGFHLGGRFRDFHVEQDATDNAFVFSWNIVTDIPNDFNVFIFNNGVLQDRVVASYWIFSEAEAGRRYLFEFLILPAENKYEDPTFMSERNLKDRLTLSYELSGEVQRVEIFKNVVGMPTIDLTADPVATFTKAVASIEGNEFVDVTGSWPKEIEQSADIVVRCEESGVTGVAQMQWTWLALQGDPFTTRSFYDPIALNGLRLRFDEGASFTEGETFTIRVRRRSTTSAPTRPST